MLREQLPGCSNKKKAKVVIEENHYELGRVIGQGTFGKVFQAVDTRTGDIVAIKQVFQDTRFKNRELQVISRLDSDNVIYMKDYYFINKKQDRYLYLVMDYYQMSLQGLFKRYRKQKKTMDAGLRKIITFQLFKGLYYLQHINVCHRDLKPPNILINPQTFELRICDFGSAKIFDRTEKNVAYICSRYYRAPQLLFEYTKYRTEIDVWSAGCIMCELMTNQPIFPGDSTVEQLIQIMKVLGSPPKSYLQRYASDLVNQVNLPSIPAAGWNRVFKKYSPQPQLIDLISKIMVYDIQQRYTPMQILMHRYFHDLTQQKYKPITEKIPNIFQFSKLRSPKNDKQILQLQRTYCSQIKYSKSKNYNHNKQNQGYKLETNDCTPQPVFQLSASVNKQYIFKDHVSGNSNSSVSNNQN